MFYQVIALKQFNAATCNFNDKTENQNSLIHYIDRKWSFTFYNPIELFTKQIYLVSV